MKVKEQQDAKIEQLQRELKVPPSTIIQQHSELNKKLTATAQQLEHELAQLRKRTVPAKPANVPPANAQASDQ